MQPKAALDDLLQYIRILILDDDDNLANAARTSLNLIGYPYVEYTDDPSVAWDKLPSTNILLIDHFLGYADQNGIEFTREAKKKFGNELDVIIYSGSVGELVHFAIEAGATACLEKPLNFEYLSLWIKETAKRIWFEKILNAIPDEIAVLAPNVEEFGRILYANETKKSKHEKGKDPLEGDYCWQRFEKRGFGSQPCPGCIPLEALLDKKACRNFWSYKTLEGKEESVDIHAAPIFDQINNVRCIVETCRDRTQQETINRYFRRIERETDWDKRLDIFLNGFIELGYERVRFYKRESTNGLAVYHGVYQVGMPASFNVKEYSHSEKDDIPTQIITQSKFPALFIVKQTDEYNWVPSLSSNSIYKVSDNRVPNNHILEKKRWIDIPVIANREIIAKISIEPTDPNRFVSSHDLELLNRYAEWAGQALVNAEQREKLRLKDETNQIIIQMNQKMSKMPIHHWWPKLAVRRICRALNTSSCSLFLLEVKNGHEKLVRKAIYARDYTGKTIKKLDFDEEYEPGEHIVGSVFQFGRNRRIQNLEHIADRQRNQGKETINLEYYDQLTKYFGQEIRNVMCVVLRTGRDKIGVLRVLNKHRADVFGNRDFTSDDLNAFIALAGQMSVAFETKELFDQVNASQQYKEFITQEYSHTMKNMMQPVVTISGLLQKDSDNKELWAMLEDEISKMKTTINTMMQLVRLDSQELQLVRKSLDINDLIFKVIRPYKVVASDSNMEIIVNVNSSNEEFYLDERLISDAIANLLDNAIKYGDENSPIYVSHKCDQNVLEIAVKNFGPEISASDREKIFQKYYTGANNVVSSQQTGLGLPYVKAVTEAHGGEAFVDPKFNKGTKVVMRIPFEKNRRKS